MLRREWLGLAAGAAALALDAEAGATTSRASLRKAYAGNVDALEQKRQKLGQELARAKSAKARAKLLARAETALLGALDDRLLPAWLGTEWDFHGTSTEPGRGKIACGYFVTTLLAHAGYRVERAKLAQQPSERIVKTMAADSATWRFRKGDEAAVVDAIKKEGPGLYIVGLDNHVGFLRVQGGLVAFWHSSYYGPREVVREDPKKSVRFQSAYHVVGEVTTRAGIERWLSGAEIATVTG